MEGAAHQIIKESKLIYWFQSCLLTNNAPSPAIHFPTFRQVIPIFNSCKSLILTELPYLYYIVELCHNSMRHL